MFLPSSIKILVAEPMMIHRKPLIHLLTELDCVETTEVENGPEAMKRLRTKPHDGIICSPDLDKVGGLLLLKRIRRDPDLKNLKVMMFFENPNQARDRIIKATRVGLDGYLKFPFQRDEVYDLLERIWN